MSPQRQPYVTPRRTARRRSAAPSYVQKAPRRRHNPVPGLAVIILLLLGGSIYLIIRLFEPTPSSGPLPTGAAHLTALPDQTTGGDTPAPGETAAPTDAGDDPMAAFFTQGEEVVGPSEYRNDRISITITQQQAEGVTYYVADVRVRDASLLSSALARGRLGSGLRQDLAKLAQDSGAVLAVTGDRYDERRTGIVLRNGALYRDWPVNDVCALLPDGTLAVYAPGDPDCDGQALLDKGALQVWSSGPSLLKNGQAIDDFSTVALHMKYPRAAIGMIEPLHYVLVVVDGRRPDHSVGMTLAELSRAMADLKCTTAYSLTQGNAVQMIFNGQLVNRPTGEEWEHAVSDAIIVSNSYTPLT